jgi:hypothetical protein
MAEVQTTPPESLPWHTIRSPLLRVVIVGFSTEIGEQPGEIPEDSFVTFMAQAFPNREDPENRELSYRRFGTWGARNILINELSDLQGQASRKVDTMATRLAEMAGGDEASWRAAGLATEVLGTPERSQAIPLLRILSEQARVHRFMPDAVAAVAPDFYLR